MLEKPMNKHIFKMLAKPMNNTGKETHILV